MGRGNILVVDDDLGARYALGELLRDEGYRVTIAANGAEALATLAAGAPDIILTDLKMPGMGGIELLEKLRARDSDAAVIVMTAFGAVETAVEALQHGAGDYLVKPLKVAVLVRVIDREMERRTLRLEAARAKLRLEAANRDLEAFAARVAHDLRAPLAPLTLLAASLRVYSGDPMVLRIAERIAATAHRASDMIEGLLTFSSESGQDREAVTVAATVVRQSLEDLAQAIAESRVAVDVDLDEAAVVACSPGLFRQVVDNLVGNALKHLAGRERRWMGVCVRVGADGRVELEVNDSGPGIPADALLRIFDLFYRVPGNTTPGVGIGLATVRRIVDAHGGEVVVRSELGEGAFFLVRLPSAERA